MIYDLINKWSLDIVAERMTLNFTCLVTFPVYQRFYACVHADVHIHGIAQKAFLYKKGGRLSLRKAA